MSLLAVSLRRHKDPAAPPPPSTGMAMPRGAVNGWGTAADFYDSVGVNIHVLGGQFNGPQMIQYAAEMGMRHVRDGAIPSWTSFWTTNFGRPFWTSLRNRNRALPTPSATDQGHPIFMGTIVDPWGPNLAQRVTAEMQAFVSGQTTNNPATGASRRISSGIDFTPTMLMQFFGGGHQHYDGNPAPNAARPYVGNPVSNASWPFSDPECPWEVVAMLGGPNEPNAPPAGVAATDGLSFFTPVPYGTEAKQLSAWVHAMKVAKDGQAGQGYGQAGVTLTGNRRIVTEAGLVTTAPLVKQIPAVGYVSMNADWVYDVNGGTGRSSQFDMSRGSPNEVDCGDFHPYVFAAPSSIRPSQ